MSASFTVLTGYGVSLGLACAPLIRMTPPVITDPGPVRDALVQLTLQRCKDLAASALYAREPDTARAAQRTSDAFLAAACERAGGLTWRS
ncbi:hypothetical protein [Streptomyces sp. NPDC029004]|uniref:hypothetical protein n=1 Tax=Streptomyces sp. NPDC029004 TaxID=3154490 RepID=UPI00340A2FEF